MRIHAELRQIDMPLSKNLKRIRTHKGLTQGQLADLSGVSMQQISKMERGESENPELGTIKRLCVSLGTSADDLIFEEGERGPNDELRMLFEEVKEFDEEESKALILILESMIVRHHANRARKLSDKTEQKDQ